VLDLRALLEVWPAVIETVREDALLCACLSEARPVELEGRELTIAFPMTGAFHRRQAEDPDRRAALIEGVRAITGLDVRLTFELRDLGAAEAPAAEEAPSDADWVTRLKAEFDAEEILEDPAEPEPRQEGSA
jgi:hypothetical protein